MADIRTTKGDVEGGNTSVYYQETDSRYFETNAVAGGLEISKFTNREINHVVIPKEINGKTVRKIGNYAFEDCTNLTSVEIPGSITWLGGYVFQGCTKLTIYCEEKSQPGWWNDSWNYSKCPVVWNCKNNDVANNGKIYLVEDGVRYSIYEGKATVEGQSTAITTSNIKEKISYKGKEYAVTTIGELAFFGCKGLTSVVIPNSVTSIGNSAFSHCTKLTSITIPNSVRSIGERPFYGCEGLASITIGDSVRSIGGCAFYGCRKLTSVVIPNSVRSIGERAFSGCTKLTIYCKAKRKPLFGWKKNWNSSNCPVVWGHKEN